MRATMLAALALAVAAGCSPDIVPGAYLCGPEQACPDDLVCNGEDNLCVAPGGALPFACGNVTEVEPNDGVAAAQPITNLGCASPLVQVKGCTPLGDVEDFYQFDVPANCGATIASIRLSSPIAYEELALRLDGATSIEGDAAMCGVDPAPDDGAVQRCLSQPVTAGRHYTLRVARSGSGDCDGQCAYNRYTLTVQLGTP